MSFYALGSKSTELKVKSLRNTIRELFHSRLLVSGGHRRVDDGLSTPFPAGQKWWRNGWGDMQGERPEFSREIALTDQFAGKYIGRLFTKHTLLHGLATAHTPRLRLYFSKINWWQKLNSCINYQMAIWAWSTQTEIIARSMASPPFQVAEPLTPILS